MLFTKIFTHFAVIKPQDLLPILKEGSQCKIIFSKIFEKATNLWPYFILPPVVFHAVEVKDEREATTVIGRNLCAEVIHRQLKERTCCFKFLYP